MEIKKILLVGNSAKDYALIKKIREQNDEIEIFVISHKKCFDLEGITYVDIREDKPTEILTFAIENSIDFTIVTSQTALKSDITEYFSDNGQEIFAPTASAADFVIDKAFCKKFLYKMNISTPKFAIYEKEQLAIDYLKTAKYPVIISCQENNKGRDRFACPTYSVAKTFTEDLFYRNESKVVIEEFVNGHEFTFYTITDGYEVLPITSVANYKFLKEGDGGLLTKGVGCYCHDYKISKEVEFELLDIINNILVNLQAENTPYVGILGVDCVLKNDGSVSVLEFTPFFKDHDCNAVLNLINNNLISLFQACSNGSFADDYESLDISEQSSVSCVLFSNKDNSKIQGIRELENSEVSYSGISIQNNEYLSSKNQQLVLTSSANTLNRARKNLYDDIEMVKYYGKFFRQDICSD